MNTAMTHISKPISMPAKAHRRAHRGWVLYDGRCSTCRAGARRFGGVLRRRGFVLQPLQRAWVVRRLGLPRDELLHEMRVLTMNGQVVGGADAILYLAEFIWWARPLSIVARLPGAMHVLRRVYRAIAERRGCSDSACAVREPSRARTWLPAVIVLAGGVAVVPFLPRWAWMWTLAFSLYTVSKWLAWRSIDERIRRHAGLRRNLGFLFAWPGMSATTFLDRSARAVRPRGGEWISAALKMSLGIALVWGICRRLPTDQELLVGWVGMIGLILVLHFGAFHLLSLTWRHFGVDAPHMFRWPIAATSLGDFWGNRWNGGFRQLAHDFVFQPVRRRSGVAIATLMTFLASGVIHDLVISLPAGGGFGLPTAYFAMQGCGVLAERSRFGQRQGLRRGVVGRVFAIVIVAAPAFWLFHPPFVRAVILPFLRVIGSI